MSEPTLCPRCATNIANWVVVASDRDDLLLFIAEWVKHYTDTIHAEGSEDAIDEECAFALKALDMVKKRKDEIAEILRIRSGP